MAMIKCPECRKDISDQAKACPNCGYELNPMVNQSERTPQQYQQPNQYQQPPMQYQQEPPVKKKKKLGGCLATLVVFIILIAVLAVVSTRNKTPSASTTNDGSNVSSGSLEISAVINASEYSRISKSNLIELRGEPTTIDSYEADLGGGLYNYEIYEYTDDNNYYYGFYVTNDIVVRLDFKTIEGAEPLKITENTDLLRYFGITDIDNYKEAGDTGVSLRYNSTSTAIYDVWATGDGDNTFYDVKIKYDMSYFDSTLNSDGSKKPDLELVGEVTNSNDGFALYLEGTVKNNTSKNYTYVQITFSIYDSDGNKVGTAMDNVNNLGAGETWKFKAMSLETPESGSYKIDEITGW